MREGDSRQGAMIYLKNNRIYVFTSAVVGNSFATPDVCHAQHLVSVSASVLGRDVLTAIRASVKVISSEEYNERPNPITAATGKKVDYRFRKGLGMVDVGQPKPAEEIVIVPYRFCRANGYPVKESKVTFPKMWTLNSSDKLSLKNSSNHNE